MINVKRTYTVYDALDGNTFTKMYILKCANPAIIHKNFQVFHVRLNEIECVATLCASIMVLHSRV